MKTKTNYQINNELIKQAIYSLLIDGNKITKKAIEEKIHIALYSIISKGNLDKTLFPLDNYGELVCTEELNWEPCPERVKQLKVITDKWIEKLNK